MATGGTDRGGGGAGAAGGEVVQVGSSVRGSEGARYEIVRCLGQGGMAKVWLARRVSAAGFARDVALKCITPGLEAEERVRRMWLAEAQLAGHLSHPNIAEAFALEEVGGRHYLVLEYVQGASVSEALESARRKGKRPSEGFCCHVVASVAEALDYVHALADADGRPLGIVHRDVKAANIMVAESGAVKLLDFGVAYSRMEGRDRTRAGTVKGTCGYMSPEQAEGAKEEGRGVLDGRSDLFSLGLVLVEMLTSQRPFEAGNDLRTAHKISECDAGEVEKATESMPAGLRDLCRRALAKDPADRFQTGAALAGALRGYLVEREVTFFTSECAREVREFGLCADAGSVPGDGASGGTVTGAWAGKSQWAGEGDAERGARAPARRQRGRAWLAMAASVVALGGLAAGAHAMWQKRSEAGLEAAPAPATVAITSSPAAPEEEAGRCEAGLAAEPGALAAPGTGRAAAEMVVVRPKKMRAKETSDREGVKRVAEAPSSAARGAEGPEERPKKRREVSTLARGTLIPAKVVGALDARRPGVVEAVVAEDVVSGGALVPKGSALQCRSRRGQGGRVELSCGGIRTARGAFAIRGVAVQEERVGLRVVDGVVAAGTSFLVYVSGTAW